MKRISTKLVCSSIIAAILLFGSINVVFAFEISIQASPNVLNMESNGEVVTIHTDIAYWSVDVYSVYLNGVAIQSWKADDRGNFVAKFDMGAIKTLDGLVIGDYNTLKLVGDTFLGESFSGSSDVLVKDNNPKRK